MTSLIKSAKHLREKNERNDINHVSCISENRRGLLTSSFPKGIIPLVSKPEKDITRELQTTILHDLRNKYL